MCIRDSGYTYRLPTEAEWEYCCRAGTQTQWAFGPTLDCSQANFNNNGAMCAPTGSHPWGQTKVVESHPANAFGLFDMHGNVWEWCQDRWTGAANYPTGPVSDPFVNVGAGNIIRGGCWITYPSVCRSAFRFNQLPTGATYTIGFRIVLAPILP